MAVTILGGQAAHWAVNLPAQVNFRPTSVMLRRKLFDAHQDWTGERFFDVCAGSGAMGMEAASRGAESFWGEIDPKTRKLLTTNLQQFIARLNQTSSAPLDDTYLAAHLINPTHRTDFGLGLVAVALPTLTAAAPLTIFFDPPYEVLVSLLPRFLEQLKTYVWQELWIESDRQKGLSEAEITTWLTQNFNMIQDQRSYSLKTVAAGTNFVVKVRANFHNADA